MSGNTLISPHLFSCHWMLSQLWLWSCAGFAWQKCVGLCPAGFPHGSRKQQVPKGWYQQQGWSGRCRGAARYQQQLLQQAGLSLGFPFCHSKPLMRLSSNELVSACAGGLWFCRPSSSSQGAECPRDPLQDWLCSRRTRRTCRPRVGTLQCFRHPFL